MRARIADMAMGKENSPLEDFLEGLSRDELIIFAERLLKQVDSYKDRMIDKVQVAEKAGMSVSWLDNSQTSKAKRLRSLAVRYGDSPTSAVRFPLSEVVRVCKQSEVTLSSIFANAADPVDRPTIEASRVVRPSIEHDYS